MKKIGIIAVMYLFIGCKTKEIKPIVTGYEGQSMPNIDLLLPDKIHYYNTKNSPKDKSVVLFYFSPTCPHCRIQTKSIVNNINRFKDTHFIMLTIADYTSTMTFYNQLKLMNYPDITFGIDTGFVFPQYFKTERVPFTAIYNSRKTLSHAFIGSLGYSQLKNLTN